MNVLITGGTGFIGKKLGIRLVEENHNVFVLTRHKKEGFLPYPCQMLTWEELEQKAATLKIDAVINLAGESIAQRWSSNVKKKIVDSRVQTTKRLVDLFQKLSLKTFISTSATGYYGDRQDEKLTEDSGSGEGFLTDVCKQWENEAFKIQKSSRLVIFRFGMVLGENEGALAQMVPPFQNGVGGMIGDGKMWMSWIHVDDIVEMITQSLTNSFSGIYNAVSPNPVTNQEFSELLAQRFNKKLFLPVPTIAIKTMFGEMSTVVLSSQKVYPQHLLEQGYQFKYPHLKEALESTVDSLEPFEKKVIFEQWVPQRVEDLFPYYEDEKNLEELTPDWLNFKVLNKSTEKIQQGTIINYQIKLYGLPMTWQTEIEAFEKNKFFIDNQLKGPYAKWHHTHDFIPLGQGTIIRDEIRYKVPMSAIGKLVAGLKVDSDVQKIFKFRSEKIALLNKGRV